jgi:hypothetical protein
MPYSPMVISSPEEARAYVAPVWEICQWCFRSRPQFSGPCDCGIAEAVSADKKRHAERMAQYRLPQTGDEEKCPDCHKTTRRGFAHDCAPPPRPTLPHDQAIADRGVAEVIAGLTAAGYKIEKGHTT